MAEPFSLTKDPFAGQSFVPKMNVLPQIMTPAAPAKPKRNILSAIGKIADALAIAGGATPMYRQNVAQAQAAQERQALQTARQRFLANPNDQEAFGILFEADPKGALELRSALSPGVRYEKVGNALVAVRPDGTVEPVYQEPEREGSKPREIALFEFLTSRGVPEKQAMDVIAAQLGGQLETRTVTDATGRPFVVQNPRNPALLNALGGAMSPESVFERMIGVESGGRQFDDRGQPLTSRAGAIGIAQVMPQTAPEAARLAGLAFDDNRYRTDPVYNRALGEAYFREMLRQFGDIARAVAAYNAGPERVRQAIQRGGKNWISNLPAETRNYIQSVLGDGGSVPAFTATPVGQARPPETPKAPKEDRTAPKPLTPQQMVDVENMIASLEKVERLLQTRNITGPVVGSVPDQILPFFNQDARDARDLVASVTQRNLREILGGQFAAKEAEQLIQRAYDPAIDEEKNLFRVRALKDALIARRNSSMAAAPAQAGGIRVISRRPAQ